MPTGLDVEMRVRLRPYAVEVPCPACRRTAMVPYPSMRDSLGEPPEWTGKAIRCPSCDAELTVRSQDWG